MIPCVDLIIGIDLIIDLDADLGIIRAPPADFNGFDKVGNRAAGDNIGFKRINAGILGSREINQELIA